MRMSEATKLHSMLEKVGSGSSLDLAVGVVTVSRNRHFVDSYEPRYLTQVSVSPEIRTSLASRSCSRSSFFVGLLLFPPISSQVVAKLLQLVQTVREEGLHLSVSETFGGVVDSLREIRVLV